MMGKHSQWGFWIFGTAVLLVTFLYVSVYKGLIGGFNEVSTLNLCRTGLFAALLCVIIGHISYSRVHNLKIFLAGYLFGFLGIGYFLLEKGVISSSWAKPNHNFMDLMYFMIFLNGILANALPAYITYWMTKRITYALLLSEAAVIYVFCYFTDPPQWISLQNIFGLNSHEILVLLMFAAGIIFGIILNNRQFYLGGVFAGLLLIYFCAWLSRAFFEGFDAFELALLTLAPVYLISGVSVHWLMFIQHKGEYDPLLGIYNRTYCNKIISERTKYNTSAPLGVSMVDIDHFKKVNDTFGHQAGDKILNNTAVIISREIKSRGIVCRYGGEEIILFFPGYDSEKTVKIMDRIRLQVKKSRVKCGKKSVQVSVSCGVSHREDSSQSIHDVIEAADKALYRAKNGGRNQVKSGKARKNRGRMSTIKIKILGGETADKS